MASLVVPAISETMTLFSPTNLLIIEDLPTLGLPTMAILGLSSSSSVKSASLNKAVTASNISPIPKRLAAETGIGSPIPRL